MLVRSIDLQLPVTMTTRVLRSNSFASKLSQSSNNAAVMTEAVAIHTEEGPKQSSPATPSRSSRKHSLSRNARSPEKRIRRQTPLHLLSGQTAATATDSSKSSSAAHTKDRPADPHRTNAPLVTPMGSRLVSAHGAADQSPSRNGRALQNTTTAHILQDACAHIVSVEPRLKPLIEKHPCQGFSPDALAEECNPFISLCSSIMAQQVSGAAASSIKKKFIALFSDPGPQSQDASKAFPTPQQVVACSVPLLRQAGLSERKAEYIWGLAEKFASGELGAAMLMKASDDEVMERLTAVRGLGRWSVEMFACFGLKRLDIFSTGDLGVQ